MNDVYLDLMEQIHGMWKSYAIQAAVHYDLATRIGTGSKTSEELARATGTQEDWIYRLLQYLAALGIFAEGPQRVFSNTERSTYLRSDVGGSLTDYVRVMGTERYRLTWGKLEECMRTGIPAIQALYGKSLYAYFEDHPEEEELFDRALQNVAIRRSQAILQAYDFSGKNTIVDVGGGTGYLLRLIQKRYPQMQATLFERPSVIDRLRKQGMENAEGSALTLLAGNFFEHVPQGMDVYVLQEVLHNWDDTQCLHILGTCRQAMSPHSVLLVCEGISEQVIGEKSQQEATIKGLALLMGLEQEGAQRTQEELTRLFNQAGLAIKSIRQGAPPEQIIEVAIA